MRKPTRTPPVLRPAPAARAERRSRALAELLDVRPLRGGPPGVVTLEVRNLRRQSRYTVFVPAFPDRTGVFCGCVDFAKRDLGTCKHVEAAWLWLADQGPEGRTVTPAPPSVALWAAVDRRLRQLSAAKTPPSARLRFVGSALLS
ncbi:MAG: hypothetical protein L3K18_07070 [Thermoplasmata archaeon]|nr:hypothetical protein [Thermoplasmata archaeon]